MNAPGSRTQPHILHKHHISFSSDDAASSFREMRKGVHSRPLVVLTSISHVRPSYPSPEMSRPSPDTHPAWLARSIRPLSAMALHSCADTISSLACPGILFLSSLSATSCPCAIFWIRFEFCVPRLFRCSGEGPNSGMTGWPPMVDNLPGSGRSRRVCSCRTTISSNDAWKLPAGLYPPIQGWPNPHGMALIL